MTPIGIICGLAGLCLIAGFRAVKRCRIIRRSGPSCICSVFKQGLCLAAVEGRTKTF
jgi:hypothetical protein